MSGPYNFSLSLKAFQNKTLEKIDRAVRDVVLQVDTALTEKSPVGNPLEWAPQSLPPPPGYVGGRFRSNWRIGVDEVPVGELYEPNNYVGYPSATETVARDAGEIPKPSYGHKYWLVNNLPYARRIEDGEGGRFPWSKQAPAGVVGITVIEFEPLVAKIAAELELE